MWLLLLPPRKSRGSGTEHLVSWTRVSCCVGKDPEHSQDYNGKWQKRQEQSQQQKGETYSGVRIHSKLVSDWREAQAGACPVCRCSPVFFFSE